MALTVGQTALLYGDVTQLKAIGAKAPSGVEEMLGYHRGRLLQGYWICLLVVPLTAHDFELSGNTLRSGGKLGAPADHVIEDDRRTRVHDAILKDYGPRGYESLQNHGLQYVTPIGPDRIVKVVPVARHADDLSPAFQYPMGGGSLQWKLKSPGKTFLVAAFVDANGLAATPHRSIRVDSHAPYEDRRDLNRYLQAAT